MPSATDYAIVSMIDVKTALDIKETNDDEERLLAILINGVTAGVETFLNRPVVARRYVSKTYDGDGTDTLFVPPPLQEVTSLSNDGTTISSSDYWTYEETGKIKLKYTTFVDEPQSITITFRSGWEPNDIPGDIRQAALAWIFDSWKKFRRDRLGVTSVTQGDETISYVQGMPQEVRELLSPYRITGHGA